MLSETFKSKVLAPLLVAALIGSWVFLVGVVRAQSRLGSDHRVWEEKLNTLVKDVAEIKADVKELNERSTAPGLGMTEDQTERLVAIEDMLKRANCMLAGGPEAAPAACRGIKPY